MRWLFAYTAFLAGMSAWLGQAMSVDGPAYLLGLPAGLGLFVWFGAPVVVALVVLVARRVLDERRRA
jgi:hypothetical protein